MPFSDKYQELAVINKEYDAAIDQANEHFHFRRKQNVKQWQADLEQAKETQMRKTEEILKKYSNEV